jgi:hypothetical protein
MRKWESHLPWVVFCHAGVASTKVEARYGGSRKQKKRKDTDQPQQPYQLYQQFFLFSSIHGGYPTESTHSL